MMDLDKLKAAWKQQSQMAPEKLHSDAELTGMLRSKAGNSLEMLKRSVHFELWANVACVLLCPVFIMGSYAESVKIAAWLVLITGSGFIIYYYKKLSLLNRFNLGYNSVKENLASFIIRFEKYLNFYRRGYEILIPVSLIAGALIGLQEATGYSIFQMFVSYKIWLVLVFVLFVLGYPAHLGIKWYFKKLYGNYLSKLKSVLEDLQD